MNEGKIETWVRKKVEIRNPFRHHCFYQEG